MAILYFARTPNFDIQSFIFDRTTNFDINLSSETQLRLNKKGTFVEGRGGDRQHNFGIMFSSEAQRRYQNLFIENKNDIKIFLSDFSNCRVKNTPLVRTMDAFRSCILGLTYVAHVFKTHYDKLHYALN